MEANMTPEQRLPPPPPESPLGVFRRMEENRKLGERMDVPRFLADVQTLDQLKATEVPELLEHLRNLGKMKIIWGTVFNRLKEEAQQNNQAAVLGNIHLAELLGMQELPEMADFLSQLKSKHEGPEPVAIKEPETRYEIKVYTQPWQEIFGGAPPPWSGRSGHVYQPYQHPELVVKVFDKRPQDFQQELAALKKLQGLPHVVKLRGYGSPDPTEAYLSPNQYLVKEFIEGGNLSLLLLSTPSFPLKAEETPSVDWEDWRRLATWHISSLEALAEIHERGIVIGDFKFDDYLWDSKRGRTVLIDFANSLDMNDPEANKLPINDIFEFLPQFFYMTPAGKDIGMRADDVAARWPAGGLNLKTLQLLKEKTQELGAPVSLVRIIEFFEEDLKSFSSSFPPKTHSSQEYTQALKDYFREVGLYGETLHRPGNVDQVGDDLTAPDDLRLSELERNWLKTLMSGDEDLITTKADVLGRTPEGYAQLKSFIDRGFLNHNPERTKVVVTPLGRAALYLSEHPPSAIQSSEVSETKTLEATAPVAPEVSHVSSVGFSEAQGPRRTMEDAHTIIENFGGKPDQSFFAVYDGHGGRQVADFAASRLHELLLSQLISGVEPKEALRQAYLTADQEIEQKGIRGGATAITAFIQNNKLFVANAGDARAVLNRKGEAMRLSYDHKPDDSEEQKRIEAAGGRVTPRTHEDVARVAGYAIARSLGDRSVKLIIPDPYLREEQISPQDTQLILACDGIWDVISDQEAVDLIRNEPDSQKASEILKNEALKRGSTDNISVLVVKLF